MHFRYFTSKCNYVSATVSDPKAIMLANGVVLSEHELRPEFECQAQTDSSMFFLTTTKLKQQLLYLYLLINFELNYILFSSRGLSLKLCSPSFKILHCLNRPQAPNSFKRKKTSIVTSSTPLSLSISYLGCCSTASSRS